MTRRKTLPQQRAEQTRRAIVSAAERVFVRKGHGEGTVDDIIAEAGISRGAFYHHFAGKEEVFRGLLEGHVKDQQSELKPLAPGTSLSEAMQALAAFQTDHLIADRESGALSLEFWAHAGREPWARQAVTDFHLGIRRGLARLIRGGQKAGIARADLQPEVGAYLLLALYEGIAVLQALDDKSMSVEKLSAPWADLMVRFLEPHKQSLAQEGGVGK